MANQILLKQSSTANAVPTTSDLAFGELAVNTNNGKVFLKINPGTGNVIATVGLQEAEYVYYVSKSGNDAFDGKSLSTAFLTLKAAVTAANVITTADVTAKVCIFLKSGDYTEDNPISMAPRVTIVGDNLRSVSVRPANPTQDILWVRNGCYVTGITFRSHLAPGAAVAFPSSGTPLNNVINTSPYIQNCSSITTTGAGMRIDGSLAGGLKSMVSDAYTQINQGGIGVHILNEGYSQLVSIFTICTSDGVLAESGGYCSLTNSNTSFGDIGLRADGVSPVLYTGVSDGVDQIGNFITVDGLSNRPYNNNAVSFDGGITYFTIYNTTPLVSGSSTLELASEIQVPLPDNTPAIFVQRSTINASSHTFEYVGTGTNLLTALPQAGGIPIQANEVVQTNGGEVVYTSTDQRGDFRIGDQLTINSVQGTITGEAFDRSLFAVMTPYILAIEG
jgi:hypothetical protein